MNKNSGTCARRSHARVPGVPGGEEKEHSTEKYLRNSSENFSHLSKSKTYRLKKLSESQNG